MQFLRKTHKEGNYSKIPQCKNCVDGGLEQTQQENTKMKHKIV